MTIFLVFASASISFIESDSVKSKTFIPFDKGTQELISQLPTYSKVRKAVEKIPVRSNITPTTSEKDVLFKILLNEQTEQHRLTAEKFNEYIREARTAEERQLGFKCPEIVN